MKKSQKMGLDPTYFSLHFEGDLDLWIQKEKSSVFFIYLLCALVEVCSICSCLGLFLLLDLNDM